MLLYTVDMIEMAGMTQRENHLYHLLESPESGGQFSLTLFTDVS